MWKNVLLTTVRFFVERYVCILCIHMCVRRLISLGGNTGGHAWLDIDIYDGRGKILSP
jgi:hypothetical protein